MANPYQAPFYRYGQGPPPVGARPSPEEYSRMDRRQLRNLSEQDSFASSSFASSDDDSYSKRRPAVQQLDKEFRRFSLGAGKPREVGDRIDREARSGPVVLQQQQRRARSRPRETFRENYLEQDAEVTVAPAHRHEFPGQQRRRPVSLSLDRRQERLRQRGYHYAGPAPSARRAQGGSGNAEKAELKENRQTALILPAEGRRKGVPHRSSSSSGRATAPPQNELQLRGRYVTKETATKEIARRTRSVDRSRVVKRLSEWPPADEEMAGDSLEQTTAVRLDLGGREVDIAVKDPNANRRRGPAIGSITINQNAKSKKGNSIRPRAWELERPRSEQTYSESSSSSSSDEYSRFEREQVARRRVRSASVGNALPTRVPLRIAAPAGPPQSLPPSGELKHTRISRRIVTREALTRMGYDFEETGDTFTVLKLLRPEEIDTIVDLTARIRAARHDRRRARSQERRLELEYHSENGLDQPEPGYAERRMIMQIPSRRPPQFDHIPGASRARDREELPMPGGWPGRSTHDLRDRYPDYPRGETVVLPHRSGVPKAGLRDVPGYRR